MADPLALQRELAELDDRQALSGLSPDEAQRRELLRDALGIQVRDQADDVGYVFDPESGYFWHPVARHWYEPTTGTYFDEAGSPLEVAAAPTAQPLPAPIELPPDDGELAWPEAGTGGEEPPEFEPSAAAGPGAVARDDGPPEVPAPLALEDADGRPDDAVELVGGVGFLAAAAGANEAAPAPPQLDLPPDEGPLELAQTVEFLEMARAAQADLGELDVDLDDEPAGTAGAPDGEPPPVPVAVHRFADRRERGPRRGAQELDMASTPDAREALAPPPEDVFLPPPAAPAPGAEDELAPGPAEPDLLADADVALVDEPFAPPDDGSVAADGRATPPLRPPPLPQPRAAGAEERPALPGPDGDFERYAPALAEEPARPFEVAGSAWAAVLDAPERSGPPPAREAPPRPPPPVLPSVGDRAGTPPALAPVGPAAPGASVPPAPPPEREEPSPSAGPPSFADELFGGTAASPTFVSGERQVVIHTREGQALRGSLRDADLEASTLPLETRGGTVRIPVGRVRAVFFMVPIGAPLPAPRGRRARVVFEDGRPVSGLVADYHHDDPGFFLMPLESRGRTERIYVYREGIRSIAFA